MNGRPPQGFPVNDRITDPTSRAQFSVYNYGNANTLYEAHTDGFVRERPVMPQATNGATPPSYLSLPLRPPAVQSLAPVSSVTVPRS